MALPLMLDPPEAEAPAGAPYTVLRGDCRVVLRSLPAESVDAVVTDPPYGLSREPDMAEVLRHWLAGDAYEHASDGFMGNTWDSFVPGPDYWREVWRVLKPGAHVVAFGGTRTYDLLVLALRLAGFEIRDQLAWIYGSGFPKALNVALQYEQALCEYDRAARCWRYRDTGEVMRRESPYRSPEANEWHGWYTALKPSQEPICLARKPLALPTVAAQVLASGTGALHVDACRVANAGEDTARRPSLVHDTSAPFGKGMAMGGRGHEAGRWPPNLLLVHLPECELVGAKRVRSASGTSGMTKASGGHIYGEHTACESFTYTAPDGTETVADWRCAPGCAVALLGQQSGTLKSGALRATKGQVRHSNWRAIEGRTDPEPTYSKDWDIATSEGTAARFFPQFALDPEHDVPWRYVAKASRAERSAGCEGLPEQRVTIDDKWAANDRRSGTARQPSEWQQTPLANHHPTVKPVALMRWLVRMVCPPGSVVLDPMAGSGTTGVASVLEGVHPVLIELDERGEYLPIIHARLAHAVQQTRAPRRKPSARNTAARAATQPKPEQTRKRVPAGEVPNRPPRARKRTPRAAVPSGVGLWSSEV